MDALTGREFESLQLHKTYNITAYQAVMHLMIIHTIIIVFFLYLLGIKKLKTMIKKFLPKIFHGNKSLSSRWFVHYEDENGHRRRKYGNINSFNTIEERMLAAQKIVSELKLQQTIRFASQFEKQILRELKQKESTWRKKTYQCKRSKLKIFFDWIRGKELTKETVNAFFFDYLTNERKIKESTYNDYIRHIKNALSWHNKEHLMEDIKKRKANCVPAQYFTESQRSFLIGVLKKENPDLWFVVQFVYYCFIRPRSELTFLKVGDIILEDKRILIPAKIAKNGKQEYVAIPDAFFPIVQRKISGKNPNEYLFPGQWGGKIGLNTHGRQHRLLLKRLGFDTDRYKLYSWKHTGAVAAVRAGISLKELQIQLRHHSLDQVDEYLRQLGVADLWNLQKNFPSIAE